MNAYFDQHNNQQERQSLTTKTFLYLRDGIIEGRYPSGSTLIESRLADELGISRTPIREALRQLELEGLVVSSPHRGVVVNSMTQQDIDDIFTIRHLLEGQAAYWAAQRILPEQLEHLVELTELMDLYTRRHNAAQLAALDTQFHETIYEASRSRPLQHVLVYLHQNAHRARQSSLNLSDRAPKSLQEHRSILSALEKHDADLAKKHMEHHVVSAAQAKLIRQE